MSKFASGKREPADWPVYANNLEGLRQGYERRLAARLEDLEFARDTLAKAQRNVERNPRHGAHIHLPRLAESTREIESEVNVMREALERMPEVIATIREHGSYMQRIDNRASYRRKEVCDADD